MFVHSNCGSVVKKGPVLGVALFYIDLHSGNIKKIFLSETTRPSALISPFKVVYGSATQGSTSAWPVSNRYGLVHIGKTF